MKQRIRARLSAAAVVAALAIAACGETGTPESAAPSPASTPRAEPAPRQELPADRPVLAERLPYAEVGEELVYGHFVIPEDMVEPLPAVILIHDWYGLNPAATALADRYAGAGYIVLAVDLFDGEVATSPSRARELELGVAEKAEAAYRNLEGAYRFIRETAGAPAVAVVGMGFGGGWSMNVAIEQPEAFAATVNYYGQVTDNQDLLGPLQAPVLGHFAGADRAVPVERVQAFEAALEALGKTYEIVIHDGARRGFADPGSDNYDAELAEAAWDRTVEFLERHLAGG